MYILNCKKYNKCKKYTKLNHKFYISHIIYRYITIIINTINKEQNMLCDNTFILLLFKKKGFY